MDGKQDESRSVTMLDGDGSRMGQKPSVRDYLQSVGSRNGAEATRCLEKIRDLLKDDERSRGYLKALEGMLVALVSGEGRYTLVLRTTQDRLELKERRRDFERRARSPLSSEFDKGFFRAWVEYIDVLSETG